MTARPWTRATARALSLTLRFTALGVGASLALAACSRGESRAADTAAGRTAAGDSASGAARCAGDNGGITLPAGFCATVFADAVGGPRHIVVASNGDVFTQLITAKKGAESGRGAGGILALRDANRDGVADTTVLFGKVGGTGIALFDGYLYADETSRIVRYKLPAGSLVPQGDAEAIVVGIPTGGHEARNFVIDSAGTLYLNIGSRTNSCQLKDRANDSKGHDPCTELDTRAGLWKFDARKTEQRPTTANRFATGIRNGMGLALAPDGKLYATQHGRDQLFQNWQGVGFDARYGADNPAEELLQVSQGDDFGWPYCYYAQDQKHLVTAPEYGQEGAGRGVRRPLGADDAPLLPGRQLPGEVPRRRVHRLPRLVEPRARAAGRVPRGLPAARERRRVRQRRGLRDRLPRHRQPAARLAPPPDGPGRGARRLALHHRRSRRADLEGDVPGSALTLETEN